MAEDATNSYDIKTVNPAVSISTVCGYACGGELATESKDKLFTVGSSVERWPLTSVMLVTKKGEAALEVQQSWMRT